MTISLMLLALLAASDVPPIVAEETPPSPEQVLIQAERNKDLRVKNNRYEWIGNEDHKIVVADKLEQIDLDAAVASVETQLAPI